MRRASSLAAIVALSLAGASCGAGPTAAPVLTTPPAAAPTPTAASTPTSVPASPTPSPAASPAPASATCTPAEVLRGVDAMLAGQEFDAHYLTIGGELTISVWLVDPEIDPAATASTLAANNRKALDRGLRVSFEIVDRLACARVSFMKVNPMIVDSHYQSWFIDFMPVRAFVGLHAPTTDDLFAAVSSTGSAPSPGRRRPPLASTLPGSGGCTWPDARAAGRPYLGPSNGNTADYLIVGGDLLGQNRWNPAAVDDVGVEVQWTVDAASQADDASVLERLGHLVQALSCLSPRLDSLEAFVVGPNGRLVVYARVVGRAIRPGMTQLPRDAVQLTRPDASTPPEQ